MQERPFSSSGPRKNRYVLGITHIMARGKGQSTGCRNCRRRKIKCDEKRPSCGRCEKSTLQCEGYAREVRFIDEVARTVNLVKCAQKASSKGSLEPDLTIRTRDSIPDQSQYKYLAPKELSLAGFEENLFVSFLVSKLFVGIGQRIPWIRTQAVNMTTSTEKSSILALGTAYFGRMNGQRNIINRGLGPYGTALRSLNDDLRNDSKSQSVSVLISAMLLEIFEFIALPSKSGWLHHAGGIGRLIELRGPWRHQAPLERQLLESNRVTIALDCLIKRKRCFLEKPEWKAVPGNPEPKKSLCDLHNILCGLPGLVEDASKLPNPALSDIERQCLQTDLAVNLLAHLSSLYQWRWEWEIRNPTACYEVAASPAYEPSPFPMSFYFPTLGYANEITFYNAILLLLLKLGSQVVGPGFGVSCTPPNESPNFSPNALYLPRQAESHRDIATEICRSVEYHLLDHHNSAGAFFLLFPLRMAYREFAPMSMEEEWLERIMAKVADLSGFEISRNLSSMADMWG